MKELDDILGKATAAVHASYFHVNVDGGEEDDRIIYRERVYCYELYHQMRCRWPEKTDYYLMGEVDKAAHPILTKLDAAYAKPDLLVHRPKYMEGNHAIIEVKVAKSWEKGGKKDLETLALFAEKVRYQRAIYLIYGSECSDDLLNRVVNMGKALSVTQEIEVWFHSAAGHEAKRVGR